MITIKDVSFRRSTHVIFDSISLTIHNKHKIGIVGKNGCGKTTLFSLIRGELSPEKGDISNIDTIRHAHLDQTMPDSDATILDYVLAGDSELVDIESQLQTAEADEDYDAMMHLHERLADIDGYSANARAAKVLTGLGFPDAQHHHTVNTFSGGWRMRLKLAQVLFSRAHILLLDEPTNHLDLTAIIWLEKWLQKYNGTVLLISHDRDFLDNVVNKIVHIRHHTLKAYSGSYSAFEEQYAQELANQQATYEKQQVKIAHMMKYVNRFRSKASKAKQAQSRLRAIERMPVIAQVQYDSTFSFEFFEPERCPAMLLSLEKANIGYGETPLFFNLNTRLYAGQRVGLLGANGAGKSTLIKGLIGELPLLTGQRVLANKVRIGYFAQDQLKQLDPEASAVLHMQRLDNSATLQQFRDYLGRFGFSNEFALRPIAGYSGGEKARLVLAMLIWQRPALLLLDEPTNHLDMEMRNALLIALQEYSGGLLVVSHDRYLLRALTDEFWLVDDGRVKPFAGDLTDYQKWLTDNANQ